MYPQRYCRWRFIFLFNILSGILHDSLSGISLGTNLYMLTAAKFKQVSSTFGSILSNIFLDINILILLVYWLAFCYEFF